MVCFELDFTHIKEYQQMKEESKVAPKEEEDL